MLKCFCCILGNPEESDRVITSNNKRYSYPWQIYSLKELLAATTNFHDDNKIGEGGFGTVYYGKTTKGEEIAVKRLKAMTAKAEMEFTVEVEVLGRVRHQNLLGLRGFYAGGDERLIVYDYMPNLSLVNHLHAKHPAHVPLNWPRRMDIAIGSAQGLAYLHHQATPHIIHRDIKASNVLLDSDFRPKVADFGFAKLIPDGVSHLTTKVKGTLGYLAPEYAMWGKVSESCDVYSFGILLLEIISGRKPIEKLPGGIKRDIIQWVTPWVESRMWDKIVDPRLGDNYDLLQAKNVVMVAMRCTDGNPDIRPTMNEVVEFLNSGILGEMRRTKELRLIMLHKDISEEADDAPEISVTASKLYVREMRRQSSRTR